MRKINFFLFVFMLIIVRARDIYVINGNENSVEGQGTQNNPYLNLKYAVNKAKNGDVIKLLSDIVYRSDGYFLIDKELTFDGQNQFGIQFRGGNLELAANTTFKDLGLRFLPSIGEIANIYVSDYKVVFDNVDTRVSVIQDRERPILWAGTYAGKRGGTDAQIITQNDRKGQTRFRKIIAGNDGTMKNTPTMIRLSRLTKADEGVELSGGDFPVNALVEVYVETNQIKKYTNTARTENNKITIANTNLYGAEFVGIKNLALIRANVAVKNGFVGISGELNILANSILFLENNTAAMEVGSVAGGGELKLPLMNNVMKIRGLISDAIKVQVGGIGQDRYENYLGAELISASSGNPQISLYNGNDYTIEKVVNNDGNIWRIKNNNISSSGQEDNVNTDYRGRVGINTGEPKVTLDIKALPISKLPKGKPQGVLFPTFTTAERATFQEVPEGTMIFNSDLKCLEIYINGAWNCLD